MSKPIFLNTELTDDVRERVAEHERGRDAKYYAAYYVNRWGTVIGITHDAYEEGMFWRGQLEAAAANEFDPEMGTRRISDWTRVMHKEHFTA